MKLLLSLLVVVCCATFAAATCPTLYKSVGFNGTRFFLNGNSYGSCGAQYLNNLNCRYVLVNGTENRNGVVNIDLRNFDAESCCDYLAINYTTRYYSRTGYRLTGHVANRQYTLYTSPGSEVVALFHTDYSVTRPAFHLTGRTGN